MDKARKVPGWLALVNVRRHHVAISISVLNPMILFPFAIATWLSSTSFDWAPVPGSWRAFMIGTAFGIPVAISVVNGALDAVIARSQGREVRGFGFGGPTLRADRRVSPSRPVDVVELRPTALMSVVLLTVIAVLALVGMNAQLGRDGAFREFWVGAVAAGWALFALPWAAIQLAESHHRPAPTRQERVRWHRNIALAFVGLILALNVAKVLWPEVLSAGGMVVTMSPFLELGLWYAAIGAGVAALGQRGVARDLRHAAVSAVAVDGGVQASDALEMNDTQGFLVADAEGQLVGWLSRADALGSPDSVLSDLAQPLLDPKPIDAEQHPSVMGRALDPHFDGHKVVAVAHDGTPVGYIVVADAVMHVTGDSAYSKLRNPA